MWVVYVPVGNVSSVESPGRSAAAWEVVDYCPTGGGIRSVVSSNRHYYKSPTVANVPRNDLPTEKASNWVRTRRSVSRTGRFRLAENIRKSCSAKRR